MPPAAANEKEGCVLGPLHTVPRTAFPRPRQEDCVPLLTVTRLSRNQHNNTVLLRAVDIPANRRRVLRRYDVIRRRQRGINHSVPLPALDWRKFEVEVFPLHVEHDVDIYLLCTVYLRETSHCECQHARGGIVPTRAI